jgi:hypothetical protein
MGTKMTGRVDQRDFVSHQESNQSVLRAQHIVPGAEHIADV